MTQLTDTPESWPRVGVVILNWKRPDDTRACLSSLQRLDYPDLDVVVVDNDSGDGSPERIRREFAWVCVVENGRNLGFAGGCNVGIAEALGRGAEYVLLLNDDTEVAPDLVRHMVRVAEQAADIGIVGPKIYYFQPGNVIWSAGGTLGRRGDPRHRRVDEVDDGDDAEAVQDVDYVTGCAMLVKRQLVESIGALDERFFAYFEETEWCTRARRAGFRVVYVPVARMWHKLEPTSRGTSPLYLYLTTRNRLLYLSCTGASLFIKLATVIELVRTAAAWRWRPRHRHMRPYSGVVLRGITDFVMGRFGAPPLLS